MSDVDDLPARERARVRSRDRKVRGPKVVVDNAGLRTLVLHLAEKRRQEAAAARAPRRAKARRGKPRSPRSPAPAR